MPFFKIFKNKEISNKQILSLGFVLAVLSMISMAVAVIVLPMFGLWLNMNGVLQLDFFFTAFLFVFLCATQALILFGFPLYYAQDQKSHMTAFRILLSTMMWMLALMIFVGVLFVQFEKPADVPVQNIDYSSFESSTQDSTTTEEGTTVELSQ